MTPFRTFALCSLALSACSNGSKSAADANAPTTTFDTSVTEVASEVADLASDVATDSEAASDSATDDSIADAGTLQVTLGTTVTTLVGVDLSGANAPKILVSGNDFYSTPRLSPDGNRMSWLTWRHPDMPWVPTEAWVGDIFPDGTIGSSAATSAAYHGIHALFRTESSPRRPRHRLDLSARSRNEGACQSRR